MQSSRTLLLPGFVLLSVFFAGQLLYGRQSPETTLPPGTSSPITPAVLLDRYCVRCHTEQSAAGGLVLSSAAVAEMNRSPVVWERVAITLRAGTMPPYGEPRPSSATIDAVAGSLERGLDAIALAQPAPGRVPLRRLTRREYHNVIQSLFDVDLDLSGLLPSDDGRGGFEGDAATYVASPTLIEQYLLAAQRVSAIVVADATLKPYTEIHSQEGDAVDHYFPVDAEYVVRVAPRASDTAPAAAAPSALQVLIDEGAPVDASAGSGSDLRFRVSAGVHRISVRGQQPGARGMAVNVTGPFEARPTSTSPTRARVFFCVPNPALEERCARQILSALARRAYRRPLEGDRLSIIADREDLVVDRGTINELIAAFRVGRSGGTFERGIQMAIARILVDPELLFHIERNPLEGEPGLVFPLNDAELASRIASLLWNGPPDATLMALASDGTFRFPQVLEREVSRMLTDPRANEFATRFADQWLGLEWLQAAQPQPAGSGDVDDSLREAFRAETRRLVTAVVREDRSVLDLVDADYTFVNERLADHYGIPGVAGDELRQVHVSDQRRRGVLGHGSFLTLTATRGGAAALRRGDWILENLVGAPPPPPAPRSPESHFGEVPVRDEAWLRRGDIPSRCLQCHAASLSWGQAFDGFDATGRWRNATVGGAKLGYSFPDGTALDAPEAARSKLMDQPELLTRALAKVLLAYGLGRPVTPSDGPAIRGIARQAARGNYKFSALAFALIRSTPFQMRGPLAARPTAGATTAMPSKDERSR